MTHDETILLDTTRELFAEDSDVCGALEDFVSEMHFAHLNYSSGAEIERSKKQLSDRLESLYVHAMIRAKRILSETGPDDMTAAKEARESA